jgi:succinate dehydrogenase/fumarate reductase flavoprotein subunit
MTSADWDEQVDVVVAGAGGGITGAYTAAREALSVALIEATDKIGGTTAFSGGRALIGRFLAALRRFPHAAVHLDSPLTELVTDDGAVTGVIVRRNGEPVRIGARRGVLLAAGGFEQNTRMRRRLRRTRTRRRHDGRAGQHRCRTRSGHPHRGGHRPDGSGVVVTGTHPPRWPVDVLPLVHRRDLRQLRRQAVRQRVRPV